MGTTPEYLQLCVRQGKLCGFFIRAMTGFDKLRGIGATLVSGVGQESMI